MLEPVSRSDRATIQVDGEPLDRHRELEPWPPAPKLDAGHQGPVAQETLGCGSRGEPEDPKGAAEAFVGQHFFSVDHVPTRHNSAKLAGGMVPAMARDTASERYLALVEQLASERGHQYGWRSDVARVLGVHPSFISKVASGQKVSVGDDAIERACRALGISAQFFNDPSLKAPQYTEWTLAKVDERAAKAASKLVPMPRRTIKRHADEWNDLMRRALDFDPTGGSLDDAEGLADRVLALLVFKYAAAVKREVARVRELPEASEERFAAFVSAASLAREVVDLVRVLGGEGQRQDLDSSLDET